MKKAKKEKAEKEKFSEWQSEIIRAGATSFLIANGSPTMLSMAHEIEEHRTGKDADEKSDALYFLKQERLRRFIAGRKLGNDKQSILKNFLIAEEMLTEADLQPETDDTKKFLKVFDFLARKNEDVKTQLKGIGKELLSSRLYPTVLEEVSLNIQLDPSGLFFRVFERFMSKIPDKTVYIKNIAVGRDKGVTKNSIRRGYGFVSTNHDLIHIFLRGSVLEEQITYVQSPLFPDIGERKASFFMRYGEPQSEDAHGETELDKFKRQINIYKFIPPDPKPVKGKDKP